MSQESVDTALAESCQLLAKVEVFADRTIGIVVGALRWRSCTEHVGNESGVANFLICHEFEQETIFGCEACCLEFCSTEASKTIIEKIQLDPLLVKS